MGNQVVSLSMHGASVTLDIPQFLSEKLKDLGLQLSLETYDMASIHVHYLNNLEVRFFVKENSRIIDDIIVRAEQVLFRLFVEIEDLLMRQILNKNKLRIALHGGGVVSNGKAVLVLQEKGAGKSTLIARLAQNKACRFLSDDLIVSNGKTVLGIPLPIRLRQLKVHGLDLLGGRIDRGQDLDEKTRYFYMPSIEAETCEIPVSTILIPHYDPQSSNYIIKAKGNEKVRIIVNQIKKYSNMKKMYTNVSLLANSINVYHLYYKDFSVLDTEDIKG